MGNNFPPFHRLKNKKAWKPKQQIKRNCELDNKGSLIYFLNTYRYNIDIY